MTLRQDGGCDLFGRRLAAGTGDADHARAELLQDEPRPIQQGLAAVIHDDAGDAVRLQVKRALAKHARSAAASRFQDVIVAVAFVGHDGQKKFSPVEQPGIVAEISKGPGEHRPVGCSAGCRE